MTNTLIELTGQELFVYYIYINYSPQLGPTLHQLKWAKCDVAQ